MASSEMPETVEYTNHLRSSVVYRKGEITPEDYDEAIKDLEAAKNQQGNEHRGCSVCWDSCHTAAHCHHNPLVMARRGVDQREREYWRCFHCRAVFALDEEADAREHFGRTSDDGDADRCLATALEEVEALRRRVQDMEALIRGIGYEELWDGLECEVYVEKEYGRGGQCGLYDWIMERNRLVSPPVEHTMENPDGE